MTPFKPGLENRVRHIWHSLSSLMRSSVVRACGVHRRTMGETDHRARHRSPAPRLRLGSVWTTRRSPPPGASSSTLGFPTRSRLDQPQAFVLATADERGRPRARTVLLKSWDDDGFVWATNYESRKGGRPRREPLRGDLLQLGEAGASGARRGSRRRALPAPSPTRSSRPGPAAHSSRPGRARSRSCCPADARNSTSGVADVTDAFRRRADPPPAELGRLPADPGTRRVLAGAAQPAARPVPLPARHRSALEPRRRAALDHGKGSPPELSSPGRPPLVRQDPHRPWARPAVRPRTGGC